MTKEVNVTFRVEPELRASFSEAASREHRPAAQVLRELMRAYVEQSRSHAPQRAAIDAAERRRREDAVRYARASVGLEGFAPSQAEEEHARRFIEGEIGLAEFVKARDSGPAAGR